MAAKAQPWTRNEERAVCRLYERMYQLQQKGKLGPKKHQTSKRSLVKKFMGRTGRSHASIECKLMNVTACRQEAGLPLVDGYKAYPNCSASLRSLFNLD